MNQCLTVHVPQGAGKRAAPIAQWRTEVRLAFRRAAQNISRLWLGVFLSGLSDTTESTPLILTLFRVLSAVARRFCASPNRSASDQLLLAKVDSHSHKVAGASDFGRGLVAAELGRNRHRRSFRGAWAQTKSGARFEIQRLMRMNHATPNEDSR
jgi:hypothetical protein